MEEVGGQALGGGRGARLGARRPQDAPGALGRHGAARVARAAARAAQARRGTGRRPFCRSWEPNWCRFLDERRRAQVTEDDASADALARAIPMAAVYAGREEMLDRVGDAVALTQRAGAAPKAALLARRSHAQRRALRCSY